MSTYLNPDAVKDYSITSVKLAAGVVPTDASIAEMGYIKTDASIAAMGYTKNAGTITGITMNGESQGTTGVVNLGNVVTGNAKIFYGTCATAAATVDKVVTCETFAAEDLVKGALVFVTFDNTNSGAVASLTLNVNSTGAKPIKKSYTGTAVSNLTNVGELKSNVTYLFTYDGTNWVCMTLDYNTNTTYSEMTQAEIDAGTGTTGRRMTPAILRDNFYTETEVNSLLDAKADTSTAISSLNLAIDPTTYQITLSGTKADGSTFTVQNVIDLPLESVVVDGSYNNTTKKVVLTLQNGSTVEFSVADLVAGLQSEITSANKLSADLIQDGTTNKTVTQTEKDDWNNNTVHKSGEETITGKKIFDNADLVMKNGSTSGVVTTPSIYFQVGTANDQRSDWKISARSSNAGTFSDYISIDKVKDGSTSNIVKINEYYTETNYILINKLYDSTSLPISLETDSGYTEDNETYGALYLSSGNNYNLTNSVVIDGIKTPNNSSTRYDYTAANRKYVDDAVSNVLPAVTASDNGKVLMVVNGAWSMVTPVSIYSGSEAPNNSQGINGDIYLQV